VHSASLAPIFAQIFLNPLLRVSERALIAIEAARVAFAGSEFSGEDMVFDLRGVLMEKAGSNLRHEAAFTTTEGAYTWLIALRAGQVVVLDSRSFYEGPRVHRAVEAAGCRLVFLPPYSPDSLPIELAFAKLKAALCQAAARAQDALDAAIDRAVATITAQDASGFFRHCGYPLAQ
jgi:hypothetical protein